MMHHFKLNDLDKHPYNKVPGQEYFYLRGINIEKAVLKKLILEVVHKPDKFSIDNNESDKEISCYFSYIMDNGERPKRLYEDKQYLINEITNNINK